jgi:hypothetical protein
MTAKDISAEIWREYDWECQDSGRLRTYRIVEPLTLWVGETTHRVLDSKGVVHCVPTVGHLNCVLRWKPRDPAKPVQF